MSSSVSTPSPEDIQELWNQLEGASGRKDLLLKMERDSHGEPTKIIFQSKQEARAGLFGRIRVWLTKALYYDLGTNLERLKSVVIRSLVNPAEQQKWEDTYNALVDGLAERKFRKSIWNMFKSKDKLNKEKNKFIRTHSLHFQLSAGGEASVLRKPAQPPVQAPPPVVAGEGDAAIPKLSPDRVPSVLRVDIDTREEGTIAILPEESEVPTQAPLSTVSGSTSPPHVATMPRENTAAPTNVTPPVEVHSVIDRVALEKDRAILERQYRELLGTITRAERQSYTDTTRQVLTDIKSIAVRVLRQLVDAEGTELNVNQLNGARDGYEKLADAVKGISLERDRTVLQEQYIELLDTIGKAANHAYMYATKQVLKSSRSTVEGILKQLGAVKGTESEESQLKAARAKHAEINHAVQKALASESDLTRSLQREYETAKKSFNALKNGFEFSPLVHEAEEALSALGDEAQNIREWQERFKKFLGLLEVANAFLETAQPIVKRLHELQVLKESIASKGASSVTFTELALLQLVEQCQSNLTALCQKGAKISDDKGLRRFTADVDTVLSGMTNETLTAKAHGEVSVLEPRKLECQQKIGEIEDVKERLKTIKEAMTTLKSTALAQQAEEQIVTLERIQNGLSTINNQITTTQAKEQGLTQLVDESKGKLSQLDDAFALSKTAADTLKGNSWRVLEESNKNLDRSYLATARDDHHISIDEAVRLLESIPGHITPGSEAKYAEHLHEAAQEIELLKARVAKQVGAIEKVTKTIEEYQKNIRSKLTQVALGSKEDELLARIQTSYLHGLLEELNRIKPDSHVTPSSLASYTPDTVEFQLTDTTRGLPQFRKSIQDRLTALDELKKWLSLVLQEANKISVRSIFNLEITPFLKALDQTTNELTLGFELVDSEDGSDTKKVVQARANVVKDIDSKINHWTTALKRLRASNVFRKEQILYQSIKKHLPQALAQEFADAFDADFSGKVAGVRNILQGDTIPSDLVFIIDENRWNSRKQRMKSEITPEILATIPEDTEQGQGVRAFLRDVFGELEYPPVTRDVTVASSMRTVSASGEQTPRAESSEAQAAPVAVDPTPVSAVDADVAELEHAGATSSVVATSGPIGQEIETDSTEERSRRAQILQRINQMRAMTPKLEKAIDWFQSSIMKRIVKDFIIGPHQNFIITTKREAYSRDNSLDSYDKYLTVLDSYVEYLSTMTREKITEVVTQHEGEFMNFYHEVQQFASGVDADISIVKQSHDKMTQAYGIGSDSVSTDSPSLLETLTDLAKKIKVLVSNIEEYLQTAPLSDEIPMHERVQEMNTELTDLRAQLTLLNNGNEMRALKLAHPEEGTVDK